MICDFLYNKKEHGSSWVEEAKIFEWNIICLLVNVNHSDFKFAPILK